MSKTLAELLFKIRQDPAFTELLTFVEVPPLKEFKTSGDADAQYADFIFRSGQRRQHDNWLNFLTGEPTSDKEKS